MAGRRGSSKRTSPRMARKASRVLRSKKASAREKSLAASVLAQA